jgi:CHRD domain
MRIYLTLTLAALAVALPAAPVHADDAVTLKATLTGAYVHGPPSASGTAVLAFTGNRVCWKFTYRGLGAAPTISGIHKAPAPAAGVHKTAIIPFVADTSGKKECITARAGAVKAVLADPASFYVSIGTSGKYRFAAVGGPLRTP